MAMLIVTSAMICFLKNGLLPGKQDPVQEVYALALEKTLPSSVLLY